MGTLLLKRVGGVALLFTWLASLASALPTTSQLWGLPKCPERVWRLGFTFEELSLMASAASDPLFIHDLAGNLIYWNQASAREFGWRVDLLASPPPPFPNLASQFAADSLEAARAATIDKGSWQGELEFVVAHAPGPFRSRWLLLKDVEPNLILTVGAAGSTSGEKAERAQRLQTLGEMTGGIAHDLNNMLTPVVMGINLLRDTTDTADRDRILDTMQTSAERATWMIEALLRFSRGTKGEREVLDLEQVIGEATRLLAYSLPRRIQVEVKAPAPGTLWPIRGDKTQITQALMNLAVNARDAMPDGGRLTVSVENVTIEGSEQVTGGPLAPGPHVVVAVADTGTGIRADILDKIFLPFFTTKEGRGTGLGLSNVYAILKGHGGGLNVYSEVGEGTRFTLYFPALKGEETTGSRSEERRARPRGNGETILIAEDEEAVLTLARTILETYGCRVLSAKDGVEAVEIFREQGQEIRGVLLDFQMPRLNGRQTLEAIRREKPSAKVILCSGLNASVSDQLPEGSDPAARPDAFLTKPYTVDQLLQAVGNLLKPR